MVFCPLTGGLAMTPVYRVLKVIMALGLVALGRSPGRAVAPFLPGCTPIIDDFPDDLSMARTSSDMLMGLRRFLTTLGTPRL